MAKAKRMNPAPVMSSMDDLGLGEIEEQGDFKVDEQAPDILEDLDLDTEKGQNEAVERLLPPQPNNSVVGKMQKMVDAQNNTMFWFVLYARDEEALNEWLKQHGLEKWVGHQYIPLIPKDRL